jgi:hypothetical protein
VEVTGVVSTEDVDLAGYCVHISAMLFVVYAHGDHGIQVPTILIFI